MSDPTNQGIPAAPAAAPAAAEIPAAAPVAAAPEPIAAPAPAVTEAPAPAAEAPKPDAADPLKPSTLLSDAKAPKAEEPAKPAAEAPKEGEAKADAPKPEAEAKPADAPVVPLKFEPPVLPEGVPVDEAKLTAFDDKFGTFAAKHGIEPAAAAELRQSLISDYAAEVAAATQRMVDNQMQVWERTRADWREQFQKDADIGGNRQETTLRQAGAVLEKFGSEMGSAHEADLRMALRVTGAGDHPAIIRFVNWASKFTTESSRPIAAPTKAPQPTSRSARRYQNSQ